MNQPWSKKHKRVFKGCKFSLSNSFANPISQRELIELSTERGDQGIIDEYDNHGLGYTPNGGSADLREEIANLYGDKITKDHILVFPGAQVALQVAAFAFAKDCHSIVFTPGYQSTVEAPIHAGGRVTKIRLTPQNGWAINPKEVEEAIQDDTKYMMLNQPYNPAGTLISREILAELRDICERHDIVILSDEVYRLLEHDPTTRLPAMADFYQKGISCVTLSKPWGGCGVTIGWLAFQDSTSIKQRLVDVQYFGTACPGRASEIQAIMTLRASDIILEKNLSIIKTNLALLNNFMENYSDLFEWEQPTAGAICFVKFKGPLSSDELGAMMAQKAGISMKPSYCFTDDVTPDIDYFRVGYGETSMANALNKFIAFVEEHKDEWRSVMTNGEQ